MAITDKQVKAALAAWYDREDPTDTGQREATHLALEAADAAAWEPISEDVPERGVYIAFGNRSSWSGGYTIQDSDQFVKYPWEGVTHYRPLPSPPTERE